MKERNGTNKNRIKKAVIAVLAAVLLLGALVLTLDVIVLAKSSPSLAGVYTGTSDCLTPECLDTIKAFDAQCVIVLGCGVKPDGTPSDMLNDRLETALLLYEKGFAPKILITGDNGQVTYNEIHCMSEFLTSNGVPKEDIFCDHAGFSTYDSMWRAVNVFQVERAIVVTQKYHEARALYLADKLGLDAIGVASNQRTYRLQGYRELREILARDKDFIKAVAKPSATYGGEPIPITGDALLSWDE